jgi:hypothetical protein
MGNQLYWPLLFRAQPILSSLQIAHLLMSQKCGTRCQTTGNTFLEQVFRGNTLSNDATRSCFSKLVWWCEL